MNRACSATGWVRNPDGTLGWTWNPLTGCLNHTSGGLCLGGMFPCYAFRLANGRLKSKYLANDNFAPVIEACKARGGIPVGTPMLDPFYPRFWPERLDDLIPRGSYDKAYPTRNAYAASREKEKGIFVCDMGELFGDWIPKEWQDAVFKVIGDYPQHRFYLLTKQPQNLMKFSPFPENCWVGVSATNQAMSSSGLEYLREIKAPVRFISYEPLLGYILAPALRDAVNWVIIGAQTKPLKLPKIEWVEEIVKTSEKSGVAVFLKDNLWPLFGSQVANLYFRQFPNLDRSARQG